MIIKIRNYYNRYFNENTTQILLHNSHTTNFYVISQYKNISIRNVLQTLRIIKK
jgi:hypothetical protein